MALLTFISDKHLCNCICKLYNSYIRDKRDLDLTDLYKNKLFANMRFPIDIYPVRVYNDNTLMGYIRRM